MTYTKDYVTNGKSALLTSSAYNALFKLTYPNDCYITSFSFLKADGSAVGNSDDLYSILSFKPTSNELLFDATFQPANGVFTRDVTFKLQANIDANNKAA